LLHFNLVDFPVILLSTLFPVFFGVSTKFYYRNSYRIIVSLHITKNIAYRITEVLIFYADKLMAMGSPKNSRVFNFRNSTQIAKI